MKGGMLATLGLVAAPNALSLATVYAVASRARGGKGGGRCPPARSQPPGRVFALVWPVLYALLGAALAVSYARTASGTPLGATPFWRVAALVAGLNAWWLAFGERCRPISALVAIASLCACSAALVAEALVEGFAWEAAAVAPLVAWLAFATGLSVDVARTSLSGEGARVTRTAA